VAVSLTKTAIDGKATNAKATNNRSPIANDLFAQERSTIISKSPIVKATNDRSPILKTPNKRRAAFFGRKSKQPYCSWTETLAVIKRMERERQGAIAKPNHLNNPDEE
jgi:hypothetical protein